MQKSSYFKPGLLIQRIRKLKNKSGMVKMRFASLRFASLRFASLRFASPALRLSCVLPLLRFASSVLPPVCFYFFMSTFPNEQVDNIASKVVLWLPGFVSISVHFPFQFWLYDLKHKFKNFVCGALFPMQIYTTSKKRKKNSIEKAFSQIMHLRGLCSHQKLHDLLQCDFILFLVGI